MRTILVVYSNDRLSKKEWQTMKRYAFNTESVVKVGHRFNVEGYDTPVQVVEIFPKAYRYVDTSSGELSNKRKPSTKQFEIREIKISGKKNGTRCYT